MEYHYRCRVNKPNEIGESHLEKSAKYLHKKVTTDLDRFGYISGYSIVVDSFFMGVEDDYSWFRVSAEGKPNFSVDNTKDHSSTTIVDIIDAITEKKNAA